MCRPPRRSGGGAHQGGGSLRLGLSLCLPWAGNKAGVIGDAQVIEGVAPILLRLVFACRPRAWSVCRPCALAQPSRERAVGGLGACGVRAQLRPPPGRRGPFGGRGDVLSALAGLEG